MTTVLDISWIGDRESSDPTDDRGRTLVFRLERTGRASEWPSVDVGVGGVEDSQVDPVPSRNSDLCTPAPADLDEAWRVPRHDQDGWVLEELGSDGLEERRRIEEDCAECVEIEGGVGDEQEPPIDISSQGLILGRVYSMIQKQRTC